MSVIPFITLVSAITGFCISAYIYFKKKPEATKPMVCPIGGHCEDVVGSKYGKTFGIENTILGMLYYLLIAIYVLSFSVGFLTSVEQELALAMKAITTGSFLFSLYLLSVMQFKLKMWCTWCLGSAACSTLIFIATVFFL